MFTVPNLITLLNLVCGVFGIALMIQERTVEASMLIVLAGVMDVLDGWVARKLGQTSSIGKDLDSLADLVSFGVLPGLLLMNYIQEILLAKLYNEATVSFSRAEALQDPLMLWKYVGLLLPIAAALRLAKFNNDPRQGKHFYGVPTPMAALFVAGIASMIFVFSVDPNDEKNLKQVSSIETLKKNDRIFMSVGKTETSTDLFWKAEIKELADSGILLVQGPKKYRLPVVEMNQKISGGEVYVKATGFFNGYFFTLTGLILSALLISILMLAEVSILAVKQLPERIWKISFFAGWGIVLFGGAFLHWSMVPSFSHPEGTGWLIRLSLNTPITALLSALPFALVFHLLFSLIYFSLKPQQHEI